MLYVVVFVAVLSSRVAVLSSRMPADCSLAERRDMVTCLAITTMSLLDQKITVTSFVLSKVHQRKERRTTCSVV